MTATFRRAVAALRDAGIDDPAFEARLLIGYALGLPPRSIPTGEPDPAVFEPLLARRLAREPMALILGSQGFWTLDLAVSRDTLIPRADSEALVEAALAACPGARRVLDLGAGTGALLLAVLAEMPGAFGVGVDLSPAAARLAAGNAARNGLAARAAFLAGDWAAALAGRFDLVLSNPPYIPRADLAGLMPEVRAHEPARALDGGADGLDAYRAILADLPRLLAPGGAAVIELGIGQDVSVPALADAAGLVVETIRPDLGGVPRALVLRPSPAQKAVGVDKAGG